MPDFRFYKRIKIFSFVHVNLSKTGISVTLGGRGAGITFGKKGMHFSACIPGTGIYMTDYSAYNGNTRSSDDSFRDNAVDLEKYRGGEDGKEEKG